ncbi:MAG: ribosome biogenesis GTPase Der [bacterium]
MLTVCLVGKPNVGKSTIFNRLIKEKKSIILDTPGITRDRVYGTVNYMAKRFHLIDTGGISLGNGSIDEDIKMQAQLGVDEADIILFVVDGLSDLNSEDYYVRDMLLKSNKKVIVVVNKLDNKTRSENIYNYYELGFPVLVGVSGEHNIGFDELFKIIIEDMPDYEKEEHDNLAFSFIGRPNVGKSSLVNALLNEERVIVSDVAGTTRDAVDTDFKYNGETYTMIDTAGMRKKGKIYENIEKYSLLRSMKSIERSDVCVVVVNAEEGIIEHDKHIVSYAIEAGKSVVICVNKWDFIKDPNTEIKHWNMLLAEEFKFVSYVNHVYVSALTKKRMHTLMPEIIKAYESSQIELKSSVLNKVIDDAYSLHPAPSYKGKRLKIFYVHQTGNAPIKITLEVNSKSLVHFSYYRYLENKIRENFDLTGAPIVLQFKNKDDK